MKKLMENKDKIYFSSIAGLDKWEAGNIAYLFAIPKKWWNIKDWKLVNDFLKTINGFIKTR